VYQGGNAERVFGEWMAARGVRDKVVVIGKGAHHNQDRRRVTPYDITSDLFDTLARLQTDYIDIYMLHRDDPEAPVGPVVDVLNEHACAGRIRAFGGSNWTTARIRQANAYAREHGLIPFAVSSPQFSLAEQVAEPWKECVSLGGPKYAQDREWYAREQIAVYAWSSLASGFFSGRFTRTNLGEMKSYFEELCIRCYCHEENFQRLDRAIELAQARGVSTAQLALAYVLCQPINVFPIVGCATAAEFAANSAALEITLTPQELDWLDLRVESMA
jgi:aryl-alcohol dehydrogenase-like predicted oxidoreductase